MEIPISFFSENYSRFTYPIKDKPGDVGLRKAQIGAIHAISAHFSLRSDPAVVTMPTGSGKTSVLLAAAFVLRAERVLIITPSRLVREQIAEEASTLRTLRMAGAINTMDGPRVFSTSGRLTSAADWEALRNYDVVVGTIQSISPEYEAIPEPPTDLFDLVLVDEAHHSPARTWQGTLDHFLSAKRVLFTATPFRQDQREIKGRFIYTYDLRGAFEDKVFGEITYQPVHPLRAQNADVAVAIATQEVFDRDTQLGLNHKVMVRTDSRSRATELGDIYAANTRLRLKVIRGDQSLRAVKAVLKELDAGALDGLICVNMLGEGFDLPALKIAAVHSPHRSLAVTLQFVGRFARTAGENIGGATFLAVPDEIKIEAERLYDARAVWQEIVQNLSAARIEEEVHTREVLESFLPTDTNDDLSDLSLFDLEPYFHVKILQLREPVDVSSGSDFPFPMQIAYKFSSEEHGASIYITKEMSQPRWTDDERLSSASSDLFIVYQDPKSLLLFICASRRNASIYEHIASWFASAVPRALPLSKINRVLNDINSPEFFNVGMRNRVSSNTSESYRIITGSNADKSISKSDGRLFHAGHAFGRGEQDGDAVTIGISSASKVWSNRSDKIPALIDWCALLATRISTKGMPKTMSGVDILDVGDEISELPSEIIAADWPVDVYRSSPMCRFDVGLGEIHAPLVDFDLIVDRSRSTRDAVCLQIQHESGYSEILYFSLTAAKLFTWSDEKKHDLVLLLESGSINFVDYVNDDPVTLFTAELGSLTGTSYMSLPPEDSLSFDLSQIQSVDWVARGVDITLEFGPASGRGVSIHDGLEAMLSEEKCSVVYYDHGSGEMADFVTATSEEDRLVIRLYHCKGSSGADAGHRVGDVYEVISQATKSTIWALKQRAISHVSRRFRNGLGGARFVKGTLEELEDLLSKHAAAQIDFEFIAVQPGLRRIDLPDKLAHLLAASDDYLVRGGFRRLRVMAS
ncbi:DEAD/DEAH box helicase family protein [Devosia sp.]|uniref:DEAD/DEAH box helicase n=1 Tax=Devosia sp. TaxID=1871048 RepID=UPI001AC9F64D|nr:DEAD/DEAH box helicase family protein [Devosia sp.]MBN9334565.1 DEAD/DEAH box helicase family protein [Devosia sp.]